MHGRLQNRSSLWGPPGPETKALEESFRNEALAFSDDCCKTKGLILVFPHFPVLLPLFVFLVSLLGRCCKRELNFDATCEDDPRRSLLLSKNASTLPPFHQKCGGSPRQCLLLRKGVGMTGELGERPPPFANTRLLDQVLTR